MSKSEFEQNLETRAAFFKSLGHPVRLLILNLVQLKPRHGEELSDILNLNPATISHHVSKLIKAGLLKAKKDQYYQTYTLVPDITQKTLHELVYFPQPGLKAETEEDAYRRKVLRSFFKRGRLTGIPVQSKKRLVILEKLVQEFEPGRRYHENEVNRILVEFHEDVATLRREFIGQHLMDRKRGIYWRVEEQ